jgi:aryl-alcohol dehydrogenase-like predicted oxidoreductase
MAPGRETDLGADRSVAAMARHCHAVLDTARAAGVRYVDAARSYGLAERFLCDWCESRGVPPGALTIGSKWGYVYTGGWRLDPPAHEVKRLAADTLRRQVIESRAALGARLSLYQIHSATIESGVLDDVAVLSELAGLRAGGMPLGVTVTGPRQAEAIRRAAAIRIDGVPLFTSVQATWNLLEPSAGPALAEAWSAGFGVIVKEVLANGRLTDRHAGPELLGLRVEASARGAPLAAMAVAAALAEPWADVVLAGAVTGEQLHGALAATAVASPPPPAPVESAGAYWQRRAALAWC